MNNKDTLTTQEMARTKILPPKIRAKFFIISFSNNKEHDIAYCLENRKSIKIKNIYTPT